MLKTKKLKRIWINGNRRNKIAIKTARKAVKLLQSRNVTLGVDGSFFRFRNKIELGEADAVLVFGGDGSLLHAVRGMKKQLPVLGINCGKFGALMAVDAEGIESRLARIVDGKYSVEKRSRLSIRADNGKELLGLNEVLLGPLEFGKIMRFELFVDGKKRFYEESDGLIIATTSGSSGHCYSAYGKRLDARERKFSVVSLNSFARRVKPFVVSDRVKIGARLHDKGQMLVDGKVWRTVKRMLKVEKARESALFIKAKR